MEQQQHNMNLEAGARREYDVLGVRLCQISNAINVLSIRAWKLEGRMNVQPDPERRENLLALRSGLERTYAVLCKRKRREKGVDPMAKEKSRTVGKVNVMCKVCGTNYTGLTEDNRVEPLAELCPRCEALVLGIKPSPTAVKNAKGNKAAKGLIDELRKDLGKLERGNLFRRTEYIEQYKARPNGVNGTGRNIPIVRPDESAGKSVTESMKEARDMKKKSNNNGNSKAKKTRKASGGGSSLRVAPSFWKAVEGFDKTQLNSRAYRLVRMGHLAERKGDKASAEKVKAILADHPAWKPFYKAAVKATVDGTPLTDALKAQPAALKKELAAEVVKGKKKKSDNVPPKAPPKPKAPKDKPKKKGKPTPKGKPAAKKKGNGKAVQKTAKSTAKKVAAKKVRAKK